MFSGWLSVRVFMHACVRPSPCSTSMVSYKLMDRISPMADDVAESTDELDRSGPALGMFEVFGRTARAADFGGRHFGPYNAAKIQNAAAAGAPPRTPMGELTALPQTS